MARVTQGTLAVSRLWPGRTDRLTIAPNDLRTADATRAAEIYAGRFVFAGKIGIADCPPLMLLAAWFICRAVLQKIHVPRSLLLAMGACYLLLLLLAETLLGAMAGRMPAMSKMTGTGL